MKTWYFKSWGQGQYQSAIKAKKYESQKHYAEQMKLGAKGYILYELLEKARITYSDHFKSVAT